MMNHQLFSQRTVREVNLRDPVCWHSVTTRSETPVEEVKVLIVNAFGQTLHIT